MFRQAYHILFTVLVLLGLTVRVHAKDLFPAGIGHMKDKALLTTVLGIYRTQVLPADSAHAAAMLADLLRQARAGDNPAVLAACLGMEADYFKEKGRVQDSVRVTGNLEHALQLSARHEHKLLAAYLEYKLGIALYDYAQYRDDYGQYREGTEHLFTAAALLNDIGIDQLPEPGRFLYDMGNVYCGYHDYSKGLQYLYAAAKYPSADPNYAYNLYGTFGLAYFKLKKNDSSVFYSRKAMAAAFKTGDSVKIGSISGNIGAALFELKDYNNALRYLLLDYRISSSRQNWESACGSLLFSAQVYEQLGQTGKARQCLDTMQEMISRYHCGTVNMLYSYYEFRAQLYRKTKNYGQALVMVDSFMKYNYLFRSGKNTALLKEVELKAAKELVETRMRLAEGQRKKQVLVRNGVILVALLVIIIIAQLLYRLRQRQRAERNILTLQLQNAEKQLAIYVESLREKTKLIEQFSNNLLVSDEDPPQDATPGSVDEPGQADVLNRMKDVTLITEDAWQEFARLVNLVHKDFLVKLNRRYPNLTPGDIRLLTLVKLNFTRQEMAATLGISPDSVKKARQRVRKKLDIEEEVDMRTVLSEI